VGGVKEMSGVVSASRVLELLDSFDYNDLDNCVTAKEAAGKGKVKIPLEMGALTDAPVYEPHRRGKNWFAKITLDPKAPGGLRREFAPRARGEGNYYILPKDWGPGTPVEFGADYYTGSGRRSPTRWYGVITKVTSNFLELKEAGSAKEAVAQAEKMAAKLSKKDPRLKARQLAQQLGKELVKVDRIIKDMSDDPGHFSDVLQAYDSLKRALKALIEGD